MASLIVLKPGVDWTTAGGLFDWTLEFLISRLSDRQAPDQPTNQTRSEWD